MAVLRPLGVRWRDYLAARGFVAAVCALALQLRFPAPAAEAAMARLETGALETSTLAAMLLLLPALLAVAGALPGAFFGAELLKTMNEDTIRMIMLIGVPIMALVVAFKRDTPARPREMTRGVDAMCFGVGLVCGFYDGFFGPGAGTLMIMLFTWVAGMDMVTASGTAKPVNLASNLAALTSFLIGGDVLVRDVLFRLAAPAIICSIAGGWVGSKLAMRVGARLIRFVMLGVLVLLVGKLAYEWLVAA